MRMKKIVTCEQKHEFCIPPPEERRCKVHGEIVDLDRSYENYLQQQKEKEYDILSHSIR